MRSPFSRAATTGDGHRRRGSALLFGATLVVFSFNIVFAGIGLRGTDQYWYAADLDMTKATGRAVTNALYPTATLGAPAVSADDLPTRIHNLPATYLAGAFFDVVGDDYRAWLILNALLTFATAAGIYVVVKRMGWAMPLLAASLFMAFPLTVWLSLNALAEMSLAFAMALLLYGSALAVRGWSATGLYLAGASVVLLYYTRESFVLMAPAFVVFTVWLVKQRRVRLVVAGAPLMLTLVLCALKAQLLPAYPTSGLSSLLMSGTPSGGEQMGAYYSVDGVPFAFGEFAHKAWSGLLAAVIPGPVEFATELPVLVLMVVAFWKLRGDADSAVFRFWGAVTLGIYLLTAVVFQAQNRYIFTLIPFACLFAVRLAARSPVRLGRRYRVPAFSLLVLAVVAFTFVSAFMAQQYRADARRATAQTSALASDLRAYPSGSVLRVDGGTELLQVTYAAAPRAVLAISRKFNSEADTARLIEAWDARVFLTSTADDVQFLRRATSLTARRSWNLRPVESLATTGGPVAVWVASPRASGSSQ